MPSTSTPRSTTRQETQRLQEDRIADAAAAEFRRVGVRQASIDRIAEEAGVSRSTLYRRFPGKDDLLSAVMVRLRRELVHQVAERVRGLDPRATVVEAFCLAISDFRRNELVRQLLGENPEAVDVLIGLHLPRVEDLIDEFSRGILATLRAAGASMPDHQLRLAAEILVRTFASLTTAPSQALDIDDPAAVREFATVFLAPMIW